MYAHNNYLLVSSHTSTLFFTQPCLAPHLYFSWPRRKKTTAGYWRKPFQTLTPLSVESAQPTEKKRWRFCKMNSCYCPIIFSWIRICLLETAWMSGRIEENPHSKKHFCGYLFHLFGQWFLRKNKKMGALDFCVKRSNFNCLQDFLQNLQRDNGGLALLSMKASA